MKKGRTVGDALKKSGVTPQKRSKYRNVRTRGFASKKEAARWDELVAMEKRGEIAHLQKQVSYDLKINDILVCRYRADFVYFSTKELPALTVEDVKGYKTPIYRLKKKLMLAVLGIDIKET